MQKETKEILWTCGLSFLAGVIVTLAILGIGHCLCECGNKPHPKHPEMHQMYAHPKPPHAHMHISKDQIPALPPKVEAIHQPD